MNAKIECVKNKIVSSGKKAKLTVVILKYLVKLTMVNLKYLVKLALNNYK